MSDDTTTWLKKNPTLNPLRRSLKTSLRFHVPNSDMNTSIMSNPDKVKDQGVFIPRMMQRTNIQMRKSRAHEFKVPEMVASKSVAKKESSGLKQKKIPTPMRVRKSFLPVPKTKSQSNEKVFPRNNLPRPSCVVSGKRTTAKRDLLRKVVELSEIKKKEEADSQSKAVSGDSSVLRSILKKRASLRRTSQISSKKPRAKKVLFDGFENSDGEKENETNLTVESPNYFNAALDEPTVFLNLPNMANVDDSPFESIKPLNWTVEETTTTTTMRTGDVNAVLKLWESYKENLNCIQSEQSSLENSLESLLQHSLDFQKQYKTYKETSEEMYSKLSKLGEEIEENLRKAVAGGTPGSKRKSCRRKGSEKAEKIKISDRSKVIKKSSARKSVPFLKKDLLSDMEDSFSVICKSSFLDK